MNFDELAHKVAAPFATGGHRDTLTLDIREALRKVAEETREMAAKKAVNDARRMKDDYSKSIGNQIAAAIRAMPLEWK